MTGCETGYAAGRFDVDVAAGCDAPQSSDVELLPARRRMLSILSIYVCCCDEVAREVHCWQIYEIPNNLSCHSRKGVVRSATLPDIKASAKTEQR